MKLTKLEVNDFKCIESVSIDLADVNILVGTNGSGKSSTIQAIHLACCVIRQAYRVEQSKTSTVGIEELDYLPTNNYKMLGHKSVWGNRAGTSSSRVKLTFSNEDDAEVTTALCELRSARNAGISISGHVPSTLTSILRKKSSFFSAYIPGISGIPNKEEKKSKKVVSKSCSYGDSNIILRNVLLLLKEKNEGNIELIENWIGQIIGPVKIFVDHDEERDLFIDCKIEIFGDTRPIELIGTGYLQLIQIFSYILLFNPGILLIDEPDIHLHPNVQEKLGRIFSKVATERGLRILLTTHSPFIVRGALSNTNVFWLNAGSIQAQNRASVELALGWGAFGKKVIIISEDTNLLLLKKIISQWPELEKFIAFYPGNGYKTLVSPVQAADICEALGGSYKILVHRDRDSLTDDEVSVLQEKYAEKDIFLWFPQLSDIESYFCSYQFLQDFIGCSEDEASEYVDKILNQKSVDIKNKFGKHRTEHNRELYSAGGSPTNDDVWTEFQLRELKGAVGKYVFNQLKDQIIPKGSFSPENIFNYQLNIDIAPDLKVLLKQILTE